MGALAGSLPPVAVGAPFSTELLPPPQAAASSTTSRSGSERIGRRIALNDRKTEVDPGGD
jgi:hypothetical protein